MRIINSIFIERKTESSFNRKRVPDSRKNKKIKDKPVEKYPGLWEIIEEKMKNDKEIGAAMLLHKYPDILEKVAEKMKSEKIHPWVKQFGGIVHEGKDKH